MINSFKNYINRKKAGKTPNHIKNLILKLARMMISKSDNFRKI